MTFAEIDKIRKKFKNEQGILRVVLYIIIDWKGG